MEAIWTKVDNPPKVKTGEPQHGWLNIKEVERRYNAKYVGEFAYKTKSGNWSESFCYPAFYQEKPPENYSQYFFIGRHPQFVEDQVIWSKPFIASAGYLEDHRFQGVLTKSGTLIYSRFRHDYFKWEGCMVDGGNDYLRFEGQMVEFRIKEGNFVLI